MNFDSLKLVLGREFDFLGLRTDAAALFFVLRSPCAKLDGLLLGLLTLGVAAIFEFLQNVLCLQDIFEGVVSRLQAIGDIVLVHVPFAHFHVPARLGHFCAQVWSYHGVFLIHLGKQLGHPFSFFLHL